MSKPIYVVDAFTSEPFAGNPAGVCILTDEADDSWMRNVAAEMKHAETAFVRQIENGFALRWFTPSVEVDLCGHATLATAHVLWESGRANASDTLQFHTRSGVLSASREERIKLDFPAKVAEHSPLPRLLQNVNQLWTGNNRMDWLVEVATEAEVRGYEPNFDEIEGLGIRGLILTARGTSGYDFISRFFAPLAGVPEDSVTGSAHCCLAPYWGAKLGKTAMNAFQASARGGEVGVELVGDRVNLLGDATTVLVGELRC